MTLIDAGDVKLDYERSGNTEGPPLLLIMGMSGTALHWGEAFLALLREDFDVIAYDHRGVGASSRLEGPVRIRQMADDAAALLSALELDTAHVMGISMGGMIAQELAISYPQRVRSLTSIMSTTGNPKLSPPTREAVAILTAPPPATKDEYFARFAKTWKVLRVGNFPQDEALDRARAERNYERGLNPAGVGRQLRAILASGSRKERLASVKAPTLVIHGAIDPLAPPDGGKDTAASIPGAKLLMIEGMGHALPIPMWPEIIDAIDKHAHAAAAKAA